MSIHPITQRVRNNIVRVLSDAYPEALSTREVLAQLTKQYGCNHTFRRDHDKTRFVPISLPEGCTAQPESDCTHACWYSQAYPGLRSLASQGSVEWIIRYGPNRGAYWRYQPDPDPDVTDHPGPDAAGATHGPELDVPPYCGEIVDLDAPREDTAGGQLIDAQSRFTTPRRPQQPRCRDCGEPGIHYVMPHVDHRRASPGPSHTGCAPPTATRCPGRNSDRRGQSAPACTRT